MFFFFNDPEGPNLLVVMVGALIIYFSSLFIYSFNLKEKIIPKHLPRLSSIGLKQLSIIIFIQIIITTILYFCL